MAAHSNLRQTVELDGSLQAHVPLLTQVPYLHQFSWIQRTSPVSEERDGELHKVQQVIFVTHLKIIHIWCKTNILDSHPVFASTVRK